MSQCKNPRHHEQRYALYDARGIFCAYVCEHCEDAQRSKYRADVMTNSNYHADEAIDAEAEWW